MANVTPLIQPEAVAIATANFATALRKWKDQTYPGWSDARVSREILCVAKSFFSEVTRGHKGIGLPMLLMLREALQMPIDEILGLEPFEDQRLFEQAVAAKMRAVAHTLDHEEQPATRAASMTRPTDPGPRVSHRPSEKQVVARPKSLTRQKTK